MELGSPTTTPSHKTRGIITILILAGLAVLSFFVMNGSGYAVGDKVFGEWASKTWYAGEIDKTCEEGFNVKFKDGGEKCLPASQLIKDKTPSTSKLDIGTKVIAKWTGAAYYDAEVLSKNGEKVKVKYYDTVEYEINTNEVRLDPREVE